MKLLKHFLIFFLLVGIFSCQKKKYPDSISQNAPVFYATMNVNNVPIKIDAGVNGYRLYSSYVQEPIDTNNLYSFISELKPINCSGNCLNSLSIKINDFKSSELNAPVDISSSLRLGGYSYQTPSKHEVTFQSHYNKIAASYFWDFGDGSTSTLQDPTHTYLKSGKYKVSLRIVGNTNCESVLTNLVKVGIPDACQAEISASMSANNTILFSQTALGKAPFTYLWSFGDGTSSTLPNPSHHYTIRGSYPVTLKVTDANNDESVVNYNAVTSEDASSCATNFSLIGRQTLNDFPFSKVTVSWTDDAGITYSSNNPLQSATSSFQIVSVEDYDKNENNDDLKKVRIRFNCIVYNQSKVLKIDNAEVIIAVAYK